jgi:multiple sugar transport system ATP-binding protein
MNFVPATVQNGSGKASGFEVKLPQAVSSAKGTLGFRPEAVTDRVTDGGNSLSMKVEVVERLGSDQYLYGQVGGDAVTARVDPRMTVAPGDQVKLGLDTRGLHFFDAETEKAVF